MTPTERAEKILKVLLAFYIDREGELLDEECAIGHITAQIAEAQRDIEKEVRQQEMNRKILVAMEDLNKAEIKGFIVARDQAAGIADGYAQFRYSADTMVEAENMAREIRAMELPK